VPVTQIKTVPVTQMMVDYAHLLLRRLEPLCLLRTKSQQHNRENSSTDEPCHLVSGICGANTG